MFRVCCRAVQDARRSSCTTTARLTWQLPATRGPPAVRAGNAGGRQCDGGEQCGFECPSNSDPARRNGEWRGGGKGDSVGGDAEALEESRIRRPSKDYSAMARPLRRSDTSPKAPRKSMGSPGTYRRAAADRLTRRPADRRTGGPADRRPPVDEGSPIFLHDVACPSELGLRGAITTRNERFPSAAALSQPRYWTPGGPPPDEAHDSPLSQLFSLASRSSSACPGAFDAGVYHPMSAPPPLFETRLQSRSRTN
jgi:hypothetical protein